ncbi:WPP domain-interacting protein 1-like [Amaranthus tricolor]|uniref:WPP domain-interacting protein 1-like n=1 Tax=Amaranthus tricolor TaxID=29722 RepID=UPI0025831589|nr:WPP domain-interacting protein 1-like [Amaranthus tricolor]
MDSMNLSEKVDENSISNGKEEDEGGNSSHQGEVETTKPSTSSSTKGFGLKKWRRIKRRDHHVPDSPVKDKDKDSDSDSNSTGRMLKRGSANILNENKDTSSAVPIPISIPIPIPIPISIPGTFNAGADSDNSDDTHTHRSSSKSSTKAQLFRDKTRTKILTKNTAKSPDPSKKARGNVNNHKEFSSISSFESDSISCNSVNNQIPIPPLQLDSSPKPSHSSDQLSSNANKDRDPLADSIIMLQAAQLALQTELQMFGEIGKGICSLYDDMDRTSGVAVRSLPADPDPLVYMNHASSMCDGWNELNHSYSSKIIQTLERQLNEAEDNLKKKELRIAELETTMSVESPQDRAMEKKRCMEMEAELQELFKQKLEAEVQSVVITRSTKDLSNLDRVDNKKFISEEALCLSEIENKAGQCEESEILQMQRRVIKFTKCLAMQLVLLVLVFVLFVLQLVPKSDVVIPT